jgi:hypothetical protein
MKIEHRVCMVLPSVGIRRHRLFLTDRPTVVRISATLPIKVPGPAVPSAIEQPERTGSWGLASFAFLLLLIFGCYLGIR